MSYTVKEIFDTIQGEGSRAGCRSVFIRFTGCNAWDGEPRHRDRGKGACALWCDTDFRKAGSMKLTAEEIVRKVDELWSPGGERWVVLTGGEPALQLDVQLVDTLSRAGIHTSVETNGSVENPALEEVMHVTVSPKLGLDVVPLARKMGLDLKVVLPGAATNGWEESALLELERRLRPTFAFVQPQDTLDPAFVELTHLHGSYSPGRGEYEANLRACIEFVKRHPDWRLSTQNHKWWRLR